MTESTSPKPLDAEQARRRAEALTQAVIEAALDCIVTIDHEGRVVEFNPAAERTFGYRREEALGQLLGELIVPPSFRVAHYEGLKRYLATGVGPVLGKRIEITAMRADGSEFPVELAIAVVQQGKTPLFTAYLRDISERKRHELWAAVDHGVTLAIAEGKTRRDAVSGILQTLCKSLGWDVGCLYVLDPLEHSLVCFEVWSDGAPELELFAAATKRQPYRPNLRSGETTWRKREPAWSHQLDESLDETRAGAAREAGLRTGFSFPLFVDQQFRGILELYSRRDRAPELDLFERFEILGDRIAQYIDRKQAADRLRTSEEELTDFFENGPIGLHWVDAGGVIVRANRTELDWLGYARDEYVGRPIEDFHVDPGAIREFLRQVRAGHTVREFEAQLRCRDGSIRHVMLNANAYERDGVFVHTRCFTRDITERRKAESERDRFFSVSVDLLCIGGFDGYLKRFNPAWTTTLGWSEDELRARPYVEFVHPDDRIATATEIQSLQQPGYRTHNFRNRNLCRNGAYRWFDWSATSIPEHQLIYASAKDITEQRRIELQLQDRETRIRSIVDFAADSIVVIDEGGAVESFNPAAERLFGFREDEIVGRNVSLLLEDAQGRRHDGYILNHLRTGSAKILGVGREAVGRRRDGGEFPLELTVSEMRIGDQRKFTVILRDITTRKQTEQKLQQALQEAEAANRTKSQFLANISHEVRTPMAAILGYADMLRQAELGGEQRERLLGALRRNGEHLLQIINDVLDVSKIEFGSLEIDVAPTPLWSLVMESVEAARMRAVERRLEIEAVAVGRLPTTISTDSLRLRQVLDNLLSNAVKFTEEGAIQVRVRCEQRRSGPSSIVLEVEDQGIGMTEEQLTRLFRPFSQVDTSYSRKYSGTGLGLSICKRLVEALGGTIVVRSEPGEGSCFTVRLPIVASDLASWMSPEDVRRVQPEMTSPGVETSSEESSTRAAPSHDLRAGPPGRVLLAEDSVDNRTILSYFLEQAGYSVEHAVNGREAVSKALGGDVDLVLMDMQMPEMDGYEATRELRSRGFAKPIVALTAHAMRGHDQTCLANGCSAFLSKPVDAATLTATVAAEMARDATATAPAPAPDAKTADSKPAAPDELAALRAAYVASLPARVKELWDAFQDQRWGRLEDLAHQMKGSAPMYGFDELGQVIALVDQACREGLPPELLAELLDQVEEQCRSLVSKQENASE